MAFEGKTLAFAAAILTLAFLMLASVASVRVADADQCAQCYAQAAACEQRTNGSPSCRQQLTRCLQSCRGR